jgi:hypothetical protein
MKPLARIVFRENGDINQPDLIIGTCFINQDVFKANEVWQIEEVLGEIILKKVGKSIINSGAQSYTWGRSVNDLLRIGKTIFLTDKEFDELIQTN